MVMHPAAERFWRSACALLLSALCLSASAAQAVEFVGHSCFALGAKNYDPQTCIRYNRCAEKPFIPVLLGTFGHDVENYCAVLQAVADRPHLIQFHLSNETCRRKDGARNRCYEGEILGKLSISDYSRALERGDARAYGPIARRIAQATDIVQRCGNANTLAALSTGLEDEYTSGAYSKLSRFVRARWNGLLIRNPLGARSGRPADFVERHSFGSSATSSTRILNNDGSAWNAKTATAWVAKNKSKAFAIATWDESSQGRVARNGKVVSSFARPRSRHFRYSPVTDGQICSVHRAAR